jgi:regulator of cell morphogenesis and NO signaling
MSVTAENTVPELAKEQRDWRSEPLADLITHIQNTHHRFTREQIVRLSASLEKVCGVHGSTHPELPLLRGIFAGLAEELTTHLMKEEMMLFPYIIRMEEAVTAGEPVLPPPFGSVQNPVAMMIHEHDGAGEALSEMRRVSNGYTLPADSCSGLKALNQSLANFEADLHRHISLENEILFPRAIGMERGH